jgi:ABC-2 type transport system permease protein
VSARPGAGPLRRPASPPAFVGSVAVVWRLVLGQQAARGRVVALGALGLVAVVIGAGIGFGDTTDRVGAAVRLVDVFGLTLFAPVATLVFAAAALGDPWDDGTLVYLWLRPVRRSAVVLGAFGATLTVALPLVVTPVVVGAALARAGGATVVAALAATSLAVVAYAALFTLVGLFVRRSLVWGLVYVLIWEGFVALAGAGAARLALRAYTRSLVSAVTGEDLRLAEYAPLTAVAVPLAVAVVALVAATRRLVRMEVA